MYETDLGNVHLNNNNIRASRGIRRIPPMKELIERLERQYAEIAKFLPWADGPNYYRDKQQMEELQRKITELKRKDDK